jgi:phosphoglycolate phosphatase-like HAD superfamily hydrolase
MLLRARRELGIALDRSIMVGDSDRDILAGSAVGCRTVFVRNAHNAAEASRCSPDAFVDNLSEILPLL